MAELKFDIHEMGMVWVVGIIETSPTGQEFFEAYGTDAKAGRFALVFPNQDEAFIYAARNLPEGHVALGVALFYDGEVRQAIIFDDEGPPA